MFTALPPYAGAPSVAAYRWRRDGSACAFGRAWSGGGHGAGRPRHGRKPPAHAAGAGGRRGGRRVGARRLRAGGAGGAEGLVRRSALGYFIVSSRATPPAVSGSAVHAAWPDPARGA